MEIDTNIVRQAMSGDKAAFTGLYTIIYKDIYKFACFMMGNSHEAEDVTAESVFDIWRQLPKLREPEKFKSWAFTITANKCKKCMSRRKEKPLSLEEELEGIFYGKALHEDTMAFQVEKMDAMAAYRTLNKEERMIVSWAVFGGYDSAEIAENMKMNRNTVRSKLKRALEKMRAGLEEAI